MIEVPVTSKWSRDARASRSRGLLCLATIAVGLLSQPAPSNAQRGGPGAGRGQPNPTSPAIAGRVLDAAGRPVPDAFVTVLTPQVRPDNRPFSFVSAQLHVITGEGGEFRLDGLPAGRFYVVVLPHNPPLDADQRANRSGLANTFYPSAPGPEGATLVPATPGAGQPLVVTLPAARLATISGTVIGANGQPVHGGVLGLTHGDGLFGLDSRGLKIRSDGAFGAAGLQPGTYFLQFHESAWPPPLGTTPLVSGAKVIVTGEDVRFVRVMPITMVRASGRLVIDPGLMRQLDPSSIKVAASPVSFDGNPGPQRPGTVAKDLTFAFQTWPGRGRVRVRIASREWVVSAVRRNGVDVTAAGIDFVEGREVTGLEVHLLQPARGRRPTP